LAAGLGISIVGAGLALLFPLIGIAMIACGVIAIIWGTIITVRRS
jgi:hypothetical protein